MERKRLGRNLRLYLLGQMVSLAGLVGMALALIPLLSSLVNAETFQVKDQWTIYMPYGSKVVESLALPAEVLAYNTTVTLLLAAVILAGGGASLAALVQMRQEHHLYRRAMILTLAAIVTQILSSLLRWDGPFVIAAWLAMSCAGTVSLFQGTRDILIRHAGELEPRYNMLALRGRMIPWAYTICIVIAYLLVWGVKSYVLAAPEITWQTSFMWAYVVIAAILSLAGGLFCFFYLWSAGRAMVRLHPGRDDAGAAQFSPF